MSNITKVNSKADKEQLRKVKKIRHVYCSKCGQLFNFSRVRFPEHFETLVIRCSCGKQTKIYNVRAIK